MYKTFEDVRRVIGKGKPEAVVNMFLESAIEGDMQVDCCPDEWPDFAGLAAEWKREHYAELRAAAYPAIGDQMDALWKGGVEAEAMRQRVQQVKELWPKI